MILLLMLQMWVFLEDLRRINASLTPGKQRLYPVAVIVHRATVSYDGVDGILCSLAII